MSRATLKMFFALYITWSLIGFYADYDWLASIPWFLIPLTAICSLYPPLIAIWYGLQLWSRNTPQWLTFWIVLGTASYGILAQLYFPLLMSWKGINFHDAGSMVWVAVYGLQGLVLFPYLGKLRWYSLLPGLLYIIAADLTHYFALTFVDFNIPGYPLWMKQTTTVTALIVQIGMVIGIYLLNKKKETDALPLRLQPEPVENVL